MNLSSKELLVKCMNGVLTVISPNFHANQDFVVDVKEMFNVNLNTRANMNVVVIKFYDFRKVLYSCCSGSLTFGNVCPQDTS